MRVPTYRQQTARTASTGATFFTTQANAGALSAGLRAQAQMFGAAEKVAVDYYANEQKIKRQAELNDANFELKQELQELQQQQKTRSPKEVLFDDPLGRTTSFTKQGQQKLNEILSKITDKRVRRAFQEASRDSLNTFTINVNQDARNRLIDQNKASGLETGNNLIDAMVMGNPAERDIARKKLFGDPETGTLGHYETMAADGYIKQVDAVKLGRDAQIKLRDRIKQADTAILNSNVNKNVLLAGDVSLPFTERNSAFSNLTKEIDQAVANNTITADEGQKKKMSAADDTVRAIGLSMLTKSPDATAAFLQMAEGDVDDPVLESAFTMMDAGDRIKVLNDLDTLAKKIDTERREKEEADENAAAAENKLAYRTIINVDKNNPTALEAAKRVHQQLIARNFYTATERKAAEYFLGLNDKPGGTETKTTKDAIKTLRNADLRNEVTLDLVVSLANELSVSDFDKYSKLAVTEASDGLKRAKDLISANLKYNEFKDSTNALGDAADMMFAQSTEELLTWLETDGVGSNYNEIVAKAREINADNAAEYKVLMKDALIQFLRGQKNTLFPELPIDEENPIQAARAYLATQPQDIVVDGVVRNLQAYEKTLRGN